MNTNNNYSTLDSTTAQLNIPLLNSMFKSFKNTNQQVKIRNGDLIREFSLDLKEKEDLVKNFEKVSKELILMGFSPQLVLHSFLAFKYNSVEEGIELLGKNSDNFWTHRYIPGEDNLCFVCDYNDIEHRNIRRLNSAIKNNNLNIDNLLLEKQKSIKEPKQKIEIKENNTSLKINLGTCQICFLELNDIDNKFNLQCQHQFCKECIIEFIKEEIKNARVADIKCPTVSCTEKFSENTIKSLTSEEYFYKYKKFLQRIKIKDDESLIVCPIVDCEGVAKKSVEIDHNSQNVIGQETQLNILNNKENEVALEVNNNKNNLNITRIKYTCDQGHNFCSVCSQAWHGESDCDSDKEIKDFATYSGFILKKCVQCKVWTEKNEGCNHMTCKICLFNWCWLCEAECEPDHYLREGTPCYGKQFNHQTTDDFAIQRMMQSTSLFNRFFIFYTLTFYIINITVRASYGADRPRPTRPNKCIMFLCMFLMNLVLGILSLIFNCFLFITMLINVVSIERINNPLAKLLIFLTFVILFFTFYISGGPILTVLWFISINVYSLLKLICA